MTQSHKTPNVLTVNCMSTQKECVIMSYNINTVKTNTEQINIITKRTTLKIFAVHATRQNIKHELIKVKFRSERKIESE